MGNAINDKFILLREPSKVSKWYPVDDNIRANQFRGQSEDCPRPVGLQHTIECSRKIVDIELTKLGGYDYCWNSCSIKDCPAYMANRYD